MVFISIFLEKLCFIFSIYSAGNPFQFFFKVKNLDENFEASVQVHLLNSKHAEISFITKDIISFYSEENLKKINPTEINFKNFIQFCSYKGKI